MKNVLYVITLIMFMLTACASVSPSATATLIPIIAPAETATSIPNPTANGTNSKPTKTPETFSPFDLESKTCPDMKDIDPNGSIYKQVGDKIVNPDGSSAYQLENGKWQLVS